MSTHPLDESSTLRIDDLSEVPVLKPVVQKKDRTERSDQTASPEHTAYTRSALRLHGDSEPIYAIAHERPEHRLMVYLKASGKSNGEIAKMLNYTVHHVNQVTRQPWFRQRFVEVIREQGGDVVEAFLGGEVLPSLEALREIRDDVQEKGSTRVAASNAILDRAIGKPVQFVKTENRNIDVTQEADQLDRELAALREQQTALRIGN